MDEIGEANCLMMEKFYRQERWEDEWFIYAMTEEERPCLDDSQGRRTPRECGPFWRRRNLISQRRENSINTKRRYKWREMATKIAKTHRMEGQRQQRISTDGSTSQRKVWSMSSNKRGWVGREQSISPIIASYKRYLKFSSLGRPSAKPTGDGYRYIDGVRVACRNQRTASALDYSGSYRRLRLDDGVILRPSGHFTVLLIVELTASLERRLFFRCYGTALHQISGKRHGNHADRTKNCSCHADRSS